MKTIIIAALLLAAVSAQAQVRKCTGADGKITYSDFICGKDTTAEAGVRTDANSIDSSGLRQESRKLQAENLRAQAKKSGSTKCSFSYFDSSNPEGKNYADAAATECFANIVATQSGAATSQKAYIAWKAYYQPIADKRKATAESMKTTYCRPSGFGGLICN
jgi:hypothetical protein